MQKLIDSGLFGAGLVPVITSSMVARYNACLESLGIEPTLLKKFGVDGMGWSPEIAHEKGDNYYLSHGLSNQLAILISPDQRNMPIHFPFSSYDRIMMYNYFDNNDEQIADLTQKTCVWLDVDQEMVQYENPKDLLLVDYIIIRSQAGGLIEVADRQRELIERFNEEEDAWLDKSLRQELIDSAKNFGDFRFRQVVIPDMRFDDLKYFYTRAFDGAFVFRELGEDSHSLLVMEKKSQAKKIKKPGDRICSLEDAGIVARLIKEGLLEIDLDWYRNFPNELRRKRGALVLDIICANYPDIDYASLTSAKRKSLLKKISAKIPKVFYELERLIKQLGAYKIPPVKSLSSNLKRLLVHPANLLSNSDREVVWKMICKINPTEVLRLYISDKDLFFKQYQTWSESKKSWVVKFLKENYQPEMEE